MKRKALPGSNRSRNCVETWEVFYCNRLVRRAAEHELDNANTRNVSRPDRIRDGKLEHPAVQRFFDVDALVFPARFTFGNSGRNVLSGPGANNVVVAVHRSFRLPIHEAARLEFRAEAFNALNRPQFALPGASIGTASAGVIGATSVPNRQLQFGLKVMSCLSWADAPAQRQSWRT